MTLLTEQGLILCLWFSGKPLAQLVLLAKELAVKPHVKETLGRNNIVAILQMVTGVKGVCHKQHIITLMLGAHGIVADNNAPMSTPIYILNHNRSVIL